MSRKPLEQYVHDRKKLAEKIFLIALEAEIRRLTKDYDISEAFRVLRANNSLPEMLEDSRFIALGAKLHIEDGGITDPADDPFL